MRAILLKLGTLGVASLVIAKPVNPAQSESDPTLKYGDPSQDIPRPTQPIDWGDVNVLHTTDIHGWIFGHTRKNYPERSWSGNFGEFYSFPKDKGKDLLLVDTGDHRLGHGLTDHVVGSGDDAPGKFISYLYHQVGYDLVVPGNHDLQDPRVVKLAVEQERMLWGDRYTTSNVNRTDGKGPESK